MLELNTKRNIRSYWGPYQLPETLTPLGVVTGELVDGAIVSGALFCTKRLLNPKFYVGNSGVYRELPADAVTEAILNAIREDFERIQKGAPR